MGTKMAIAFANILIENQILRVVLNHTLVLTRGFFSHAAGCFGVGCRPTDLWPKAEVTGGKAARKKAFRVGHYKDFTEQETTHKKSLGTQGN